MPKKGNAKNRALHAFFAFGGLLIVLLFMASALKKVGNFGVTPAPRALILGIEHTGKATLTITASKDAVPGILELKKEGSGTLMIALPEHMTLREIRNGSIAQLGKPVANKGVKKWMLPEGATLSFILPEVSPSSVILRSSTTDALFVKMRIVSIKKETIEEDSMILRKGEVVMW